MNPADHDQIRQTVTPLCQDVPPDILQDFLGRMDPEYFRRFDAAAVARHIHLAAKLTPDHPCELVVTDLHQQHAELTIVAYDYFAEFATICGLLSAFALNIEEGLIYTYQDSAPRPNEPSAGRTRAARPGLSRKKIVDVFRVQPVLGTAFGQDEQTRLTAELARMLGFLHSGQDEKARQIGRAHV